MPTFIARSGSFKNLRVTGSLSVSGSVFLESLTNTAQTNVVTFNSSGQLFYAASESIRVTSASYALTASYALNAGGLSIFNGNVGSTYSNTTTIYVSGSGVSITQNNPGVVSMSIAGGGGGSPTTPGLPDRSVQFNNGGTTFGGNANLIYTTDGNLILTGSLIVSSSSNVIGTSRVTGSLIVSNSLNTIGTSLVTGSLGISGSTNVVGSLGVSGSTVLSSSLNVIGTSLVTGSLIVSSSLNTIGTSRVTGSLIVSSSLNVIGTSLVTGSLNISGSEYILGSGSAIFKTDGTAGPLLTVNDSNSGSLFTVNDISGLPILNVRSDGSTLIGSSTAPSLHISRKIISTVAGESFALGGTLIPTASYDGAYFEYVARSGSLGKSGYITTTWSGSTIVSSSITSSILGNTDRVTIFPTILGGYIVLSGSVGDAGWTVKSIIRAI